MLYILNYLQHNSNVKSRDKLIFEVLNIQPTGESVILGTVNFELFNLENQEEYGIRLEILDDEGESKINANIESKIFFIWSHFKYYNDMYLKSQTIVNSYKTGLDKHSLLLENLNGRYLIS